MTKRITKTELNKLAKSLYSEEVYCEHTRTGKRGWYLNKGTEQIFLGVNATEAFNDLQFRENDLPLQEKVTEMRPTLVAPIAQLTPIKKEDSVAKKPFKKQKSTTTNTSKDEKVLKTISPEKLLEIFLEKFPKAFFRETENIHPLQKYIHKKIRKALNCEYTKNEIAAALALYTQTTDYCQKMIEVGVRIDLEGNHCEEVSTLHIEDAIARISGEKVMRSVKRKKKKSPKALLPSPQADQLIGGYMELKLKINDLPTDSKTLRNGWEEFIIKANGQNVKIVVRPRTWKKLQQANREFPLWVANIKGKMGRHVKGGFELLTPGIQIFEKQPKQAKEPLE